MPFIRVETLPEKEPVAGIIGRFVHTDNITVGHFTIAAGAVLPEHAHPHEQITNLLEGELEMTLDGETQVLTPGKVAVIASNAPHSGKALSDCRVIDVFQPARDDYR